MERKRFISYLLTAAVALGVGFAGGWLGKAKRVEEIGQPTFKYQRTENENEYILQKVIPNGAKTITVPSVYNGCAVVEIGAYAFDYCRTVQEVEIPYTVTSIGTCAFRGCKALQSVSLPNSVEEICGEAFLNCTGLKSVTIGAGVHWLNGSAFSGCMELSEFIVDEANPYCQSINGDLYDKREGGLTLVRYATGKKATELSLPQEVTSIAGSAFEGSGNLKKIVIPDSVVGIGYSAFKDCVSLQTVNLPSGLEMLAGGMFWGCKSLTEIVIPSGIYDIPPHAFRGCEKLTKINIPDSVDVIGMYAFSGCSSLNEVRFEGAGGWTIPEDEASVPAETLADPLEAAKLLKSLGYKIMERSWG